MSSKIQVYISPLQDDSKEWYRKIRKLDARDRIFLEEEYLPSLSGSVLYTGVGTYTAFYHKLVKSKNKFETIDVLPEAAPYGSPTKHYIGDIRDLAEGIDAPQYDHVALYGVFGCGKKASPPTIATTKPQVLEMIKAADSLVKPGGTLLLGPGMVDKDAAYWDEIFKMDFLKKNYKVLVKKKMDCYIWWAQKK